MLLSTLLSLSLAATTSDTLVVKTAQMEGPYTLYTPFVTDSLNMKGQAIDPNEALNKNAALIEATHVAATPIEQGFHFTVGADSLSTLRVVRFNVQAAHYTKARVEVNGLSHYKLYVDGKECGDKQLKLTPGRAELALLLLSNKESKDSFDVKVIGDNLTDVQVNATGKRPFTIGQQTWGDHYSSVALSPSGKYLVTISYYTKKDGKAQYTTTLTEVATGRELLHRNEYVALDWLYNRDILYYTRQSGTGKELVLFTPANGKEKVIAEHLPDGGFSLSPKEDYIIFNRNEEGKPSKDGLKRIEEPDDRMPGWRNRNSLWRYDLKTGLMQRLTFGSASVSMADISADGKYLLLQYQRSDVSKLPMYRTTFVRMNAYTGEAETLMADTTFINSARFSPSGQQLLISASPAAFAGIGSEVKRDRYHKVLTTAFTSTTLLRRRLHPRYVSLHPRWLTLCGTQAMVKSILLPTIAWDALSSVSIPRRCKSLNMNCPSLTCRTFLSPPTQSLLLVWYSLVRHHSAHAICTPVN